MIQLTPVFIIAIIAIAVYRLIELFARRRERLEIISKINPESLPAAIGNLSGPAFDLPQSSTRFTALKWGSFAVGLGIGLFAYVMISLYFVDALAKSVFMRETLCSGLALIGGGAGLLVAFIIEMSMTRSKREE